jgi:hypothetical protein
MKTRTSKAVLLLIVGAAVLLAACGGSDETNSPPPTQQVPASASASTDGFIGYLKALIVSMADTLEPVDTSGVTPPTDDTIEPTPVD